MKSVNIGVLIAAGLLICGIASAADNQHEHMGDDGHAMSNDEDHDMHADKPHMPSMFLQKREIDGYTVSFHVMPKGESMDMGSSHNLMVKIEKDGQMVEGIEINSKVVHPNDKSETKQLMVMGGWFMAGYDLDHEGRHQLMVLFKTADGKKHRAGVYYPKK